MRELTNPPFRGYHDNKPLARDWAIMKLRALGYLSSGYEGESYLALHLTPAGWEYSDRLRLGPVLYWLKHNWFPATVAAATILVGIGTILAQVLD